MGYFWGGRRGGEREGKESSDSGEIHHCPSQARGVRQRCLIGEVARKI